MTTSESRGISFQIFSASASLYPNAHMPFAGDKGEPNILNVVFGPLGEERFTMAASCLSQIIEEDCLRSSMHLSWVTQSQLPSAMSQE